MKSKLHLTIISIAVLFMSACNNQVTYSQDDLPNNLPEANGTNEFTGKTFKNQKTTFEFGDKTVSQSTTSQTSEIARANAQNNKIQDFYYSFDSENKTLDFQLQQVWGTGIATDYEAQLENAKTQYKLAIESVKTAIEEINYFQKNEEINTKIKNQILASAEKWIQSQETLLSEYLEKKYNSVIHFEYELTDKKLVLSEKFNNDLSDASSKFTFEGQHISVTLNDYDHLIPFKLQKHDSIFVGIPEFEDSKATEGSVEVILYPYAGDIFNTDTIKQITTKITSTIPADINTLINIATELTTSETSTTLQEFIDSELGKQILKGNYKINDKKISLTFTEVPTLISGMVSVNDAIELEYTPLCDAEFDFVK